MDACVGSHLLLAVAKLDQQQASIESMRQYISTVDEKQKTQMTQLVKIEAAVTAAEAAVLATEKRQIANLQTEVSRMNTKIINEVSTLNSQTSSTIRTLQQSLAEVTRDVKAMKK